MLDGFTITLSQCLFKYDLCLRVTTAWVKVREMDVKRGKICYGKDGRVTRIHNKGVREKRPCLCTHSYTQERSSAADGCKSSIMTKGRSRPWNIITCPSSGADVATQLILGRVYTLYCTVCDILRWEIQNLEVLDSMWVRWTGSHKLPEGVSVLYVCT